MRKFYIFIFLPLFFSFNSYSQKLLPTKDSALIVAKVTDFSNIPKAGEEIIFEGIKTDKKFSAITDSLGKFNLLLPKGDTYNVKVRMIGDQLDYNKIIIPNQEGLMESNLTLKFELPKTYTLKNVLFDFGKATLKAESYKALKDLVEIMKLKKTLSVEIAGHTDDVGDEISNLKLSQERAEEVKKYLVKNGIDPKRVNAKGYGEYSPVEDNATEPGRMKNRRTEVIILKE
jgi:OmpA-OmpF porin, OOP family